MIQFPVSLNKSRNHTAELITFVKVHFPLDPISGEQARLRSRSDTADAMALNLHPPIRSSATIGSMGADANQATSNIDNLTTVPQTVALPVAAALTSTKIRTMGWFQTHLPLITQLVYIARVHLRYSLLLSGEFYPCPETRALLTQSAYNTAREENPGIIPEQCEFDFRISIYFNANIRHKHGWMVQRHYRLNHTS